MNDYSDAAGSLPGISRRGLMRSAIGGGVAAVASRAVAGDLAPPGSGALRFAHLTDPHVADDPRAIFGFAAALKSAQALRPAASFIVGGGDHVWDTFTSDVTEANAQWDMYLKLLAANNQLPMYPLIGNHDVLGWGDPRIGDRMPGYGKRLAMDRLALQRAYYAFDAGGWHFICLDNVAQTDDSYYATLDADQEKWLKADLERTGPHVPICVITHVPILAACALFDPTLFFGKGYYVPETAMHRDAQGLLALLMPYNVRLCIAGHLHMTDRVEYRGVTFICDGAVCGDWWTGPRLGHPPGYGLFDLWPNGSFRHEYLTYQWKQPD